jgi:hypothetical protein
MNEKYTTSDMTIAAVLAYFGEEMIDADKNSKGDVIFTFNQTNNVVDLVKAFSLDELDVSPRRFAIALKDMKRVVYAYKN